MTMCILHVNLCLSLKFRLQKGNFYNSYNTRGGPCQHGFMCGCKQWSNDINERNYNMQPFTIIQFAVRVGAYVRTNTDAPCMFI